MNRRRFLATTAFASLAIQPSLAQSTSSESGDPCIPDLDSISAEATGYLRYEHFHRISIPVSALIAPPLEGIEVRTTTLDQRSLKSMWIGMILKPK